MEKLPRITINDSARKHGIADADIRHALRYYVKDRPRGDGSTMRIGVARNMMPVELGIRITASDITIFHAMRARRRYLP